MGNKGDNLLHKEKSVPSPLICFSHDLVIFSYLYRGGNTLKNGDFLTKYKFFLQNGKFYSIFRTSPVSTVTENNTKTIMPTTYFAGANSVTHL